MYRIATTLLCALCALTAQYSWIMKSPVIWNYSVLDGFGYAFSKYARINATPKGIGIGFIYLAATGFLTGLNFIVARAFFRLLQLEPISLSNLLPIGRRQTRMLICVALASALLGPTIRTLRIAFIMDDGMGALVDPPGKVWDGHHWVPR